MAVTVELHAQDIHKIMHAYLDAMGLHAIGTSKLRIAQRNNQLSDVIWSVDIDLDNLLQATHTAEPAIKERLRRIIISTPPGTTA
jgi:hypothetical protein